MQRFNTLLLREWMQHRLGWMIMLGAPIVLALALSTLGQVSIGPDTEFMQSPGAPGLAVAVCLCLGALTMLGLAGLFAAIQAPGLARRDQQDRSIEFWLSLPSGHLSSLGATLAMHQLLMPMLALLCGAVGGSLVGLVVVGRVFGPSAIGSLPWADLLQTFIIALPRLMIGTLLAWLWLSPLVLVFMAASAWLRRWGVAAVIAAAAALDVVARSQFGMRWAAAAVEHLWIQAGQALVGPSRTLAMRPDLTLAGLLQQFGTWAGEDARQTLLALASPGFVAALAVSAGALALLVLRRQRGA